MNCFGRRVIHYKQSHTEDLSLIMYSNYKIKFKKSIPLRRLCIPFPKKSNYTYSESLKISKNCAYRESVIPRRAKGIKSYFLQNSEHLSVKRPLNIEIFENYACRDIAICCIIIISENCCLTIVLCTNSNSVYFSYCVSKIQKDQHHLYIIIQILNFGFLNKSFYKKNLIQKSYNILLQLEALRN